MQQAGKTLHVWRFDRLGRGLSDLDQIVANLEKRGIAIESLNEKIKAGSGASKLFF